MTTALAPNATHTLSLLTTTTGFVDVYMIEAFEQIPWLVPQSLVQAALSAKPDMQQIEWRDQLLPVFSLVSTLQANPVALVVESYGQHRFALLIDKMPEAQRVRISSLHDAELEPVNEPFCFQMVEFEGQLYQVPDFDRLNHSLFGAT